VAAAAAADGEQNERAAAAIRRVDKEARARRLTGER